MNKLSYLWDFDSNFLKSTTYEELRHEICLQLIKLTADLIKDIEYENRTFMSKIIVPKDSISSWKDVSVKINSLAPNCDFLAKKINSMQTSKMSKSSGYYNDFSANKDSLLTKISVLIIELSSSAEAFESVNQDLKKRLRKSTFANGRQVPGHIVPFHLLNKLKNQRIVLQKIFSASKKVEMDYQNQKLMDCEWMLSCILQDRLLNSILNRDQILDKTLEKLRELSRFAFSIYEDKINEQILGETKETNFASNGVGKEEPIQTGTTEERGRDRLTEAFSNGHSQLLKFPRGISRINKGKQNTDDNRSFLEDLEQFENTILKSPEFYDSTMSNFHDNITRKEHSRMEFKRKKPKKQRVEDYVQIRPFTRRESSTSEMNTMGLSQLIGSTINEEAGEDESDVPIKFGSRSKRVKKMVIHNNIEKIDQKISVKNFNCSCRVF